MHDWHGNFTHVADVCNLTHVTDVHNLTHVTNVRNITHVFNTTFLHPNASKWLPVWGFEGLDVRNLTHVTDNANKEIVSD